MPRMHTRFRLAFQAVLALSLALGLGGRARPEPPTLDQMISLRRASAPVATQDGRYVAYVVRDTDWVENAFVTQVWLADAHEGSTRALTFGAKSNLAPAWSPDGRRLAFLSERGEKRQVWMLDMRGGEAEKLTAHEEGVTSFAWSPDGASLAYAAPDAKDDERKARDRRLGELERDDDHGRSNLWLQPIGGRARRLTTRSWAVGAPSWSPDGRRLAFAHKDHEALAVDSTWDLSTLDVASATVMPLVRWSGPDTRPVWSPDGDSIAFETYAEQPGWYYANRWIAVVSASGGTPRVLTRDFDESAGLVAWTREGLWMQASRGLGAYLHHVDPATGAARRVAPEEGLAGFGWNLSRALRSSSFASGAA